MQNRAVAGSVGGGTTADLMEQCEAARESTGTCCVIQYESEACLTKLHVRNSEASGNPAPSILSPDLMDPSVESLECRFLMSASSRRDVGVEANTLSMSAASDGLVKAESVAAVNDHVQVVGIGTDESPGGSCAVGTPEVKNAEACVPLPESITVAMSNGCQAPGNANVQGQQVDKFAAGWFLLMQ